MNPALLFEIKPSEYLTVRVKPESIAAYIKDAKAFNRLIADISGRVHHDVVSGGHKALPLDDSLQGRWLGSSPVGEEFSTPPAQWCFSERLALAMSLETNPLMVIPATGLKKKHIIEAVTQVLGAGAVVGQVEKIVQRTMLDDSLDNLFSGCGGTC
jgi:hypothetical protein